MSTEQLIRQWRLLEVLDGSHYGVSVAGLMDALGISKATLYRDLGTLEAAGLPLSKENRNGTAFYRLEQGAPAKGQPTPLQLAALRLARLFLAPLEGTRMVTQYDTFLARWKRTSSAEVSIRTSPNTQSYREHLQIIDEAFFRGRRLRIFYENAASGQLGERTVEPVELKIEQTVQLYLHAFDTGSRQIRTYKPSRIKAVELLDEQAAQHPEYASDDPFAHAVKTWSAPPIDVVIRISARKARFLQEYPLRGQSLAPQPDGSTLVCATVAGIQEVSKWVLGWGRDATVLSPPQLRQAVQEELTATLATYHAPSDDETPPEPR
jgi:predicted DNA-binding transcriptional regulator YafY